MKTNHKIYFSDSRSLDFVEDESINLVVTSPPYPMIEMWDDVFGNLNGEIKLALEAKNGDLAFSLMHKELDKTWDEIYRVLRPGGIACINIGDATRKIGDNFQLYSNHTRIISHCLGKGFKTLPNILWRKQTNSPNKFMGSGMLPPGAYVTLENEFILVLRKGKKREFKTEEKHIRYESAYFWEERNVWFSDVWEGLKGVNQALVNGKTRSRSGAYPFELAYRLINMFSIKDDTILDPFLGTGTTLLAAISSERNSLGVEIDNNFKTLIKDFLDNDFVQLSNDYIRKRLNRHLEFVEKRTAEGKNLKFFNDYHKFPVISGQEQHLKLKLLKSITGNPDKGYSIYYTDDKSIVNNYKQPAMFV